MKSRYLLALALQLILGVVAGNAAADQSSAESVEPAPQINSLPCPADQVVKGTRAHNDKQGHGLPESFYQKLSKNYLDQCHIAGKTILELWPKLQEYQEGRRGDRDGYILMGKIYFQYEVLRATNTLEATHLQTSLNALKIKHPEFVDMRDDRLSDGISAEQDKARAEKSRAQTAAKWSPPDSHPVAFYGSGKNLVARYQFRIEFFELPDDVSFSISHRSVTLTQSQAGVTKSLLLSEFHPHKVMTFSRSIEVLPRSSGSPGSYLLVCTSGLPRSREYAPMTAEESKMVREQGGKTIWKKAGEYGDFCGIVTLTGKIQFRFPVAQKYPGTLIAPLDINEDGHATIAVGKSVMESDDDGRSEGIGDYREKLEWEYPDKLKRVKLK